MFGKKKGTLTIDDLNSDELLQHSLEKLDWIHAENGKKAWEYIKFRNITDQLARKTYENINEHFQLGDFVYSRFSNRLERQGESIKLKTKFNQFFKFARINL